jgi:phosphoribosylanthranilate isomerase
MVKIKICGITSFGDAVAVIGAGVDFVGFIVEVPVETPRKIAFSQASEILQEIDRKKAIIVLMPSGLQEVERILELKPFGVQFHGYESPKFLQAVKEVSSNVALIKVLHLKKNSTYEDLKKLADSYDDLVDYFLLDTLAGKMGGTGMMHDWGVSKKLAENLKKPVFLSGGLGPDNVCVAIKRVHPFGVDASSKLESHPGFKDLERVNNFVREVKACST